MSSHLKIKKKNRDPDYPVKVYNKFCKGLIFIEVTEITVKVNQKFAKKYSANYTINPKYWTDIPTLVSNDKEIKFIEEKSFYPYSRGTCGGDDVTIYVFKATKK